MYLALNFGLPSPMQIPIYIIVGFLVTLFVGIVGRVSSPQGFLGMLLMASLGAWLVTGITNIRLGQDVYAMDVPLLSAFIAAFIFAVLSLVFMPRRRSAARANHNQIELS